MDTIDMQDGVTLRMLDLLEAQGLPKPDETQRGRTAVTFLWHDAKVAVVLDLEPFLKAEETVA